MPKFTPRSLTKSVSVAPPGEYVEYFLHHRGHTDTANARCHMTHYETTGRHPQNYKYIMYCTEPPPQLTCTESFVQYGHVIFEIRGQTDRQTNRQAGWFLRPYCAPSSERPSSECPWASIGARRRAAGSIRISWRASCCCSSTIAGIAIGENFRINLLRQFCSNRVQFFYNTQETQTQKNYGPEFWNSISVIFENFFKFA